MNVLVTGAAGFVGGHIASYLCHKGHRVLGTVHHSRPNAAKYQLVQCDLSQPFDIDDPIDIIVHAAGALPFRENDFSVFKRNNVDVMGSLVDFARRKQVKRFIYCSTIGVYGEFRDTLITEDSDRINPDAYGLTKYMAECMLRAESEIESISLRMPGIIGKESRGVWLPNIVQLFREGAPVTIYAPAFRTRNFVWIDDLARFIADLVEMKSWKYDVVNLACHEKVSIGELVQYIKKTTRSDSEIYVKNVARAPFCLDDSRAVEMGYKSIPPLKMVQCYLRSFKDAQESDQ